MNSGSCSQISSSCKCKVTVSVRVNFWRLKSVFGRDNFQAPLDNFPLITGNPTTNDGVKHIFETKHRKPLSADLSELW